MQPEHKAANQLLDIAKTGDRAHYKARMLELRDELPEPAYRRAVALAIQQHEMYERYHRLHAWRADWVNGRKRGE